MTTRLRLRDGESNLLAGLLREDERKAAERLPRRDSRPGAEAAVLENDQQIDQTDIVMLLTPHIVRTQEITEADLRPIYIGSQQNLGLGGPPPLIAAPARTAGRRGPLPRRAAPSAGAAASDAERRSGARPP